MTISILQLVLILWGSILLWICMEFVFYRLQKSSDELLQKEKLPAGTRRKHILWFTDTINDLNGVSITLKNIGWLADRRGDQIKIVSSLTQKELDDSLPPTLINLEPVLDLRMPYYDALRLKVPSIIKMFNILFHYKADEIFISTPGFVGLYGMIYSKLFRIKCTAVFHTDFAMILHNIKGRDTISIKLIEFGARLFYSWADHILVPSREYIEILAARKYNRKKMDIFFRGIDTNLFFPHPKHEAMQFVRERYNLPEGRYFIYAGRISEDKKIDFMIDAVMPLLEKDPSLHLLFVGEGPYLAALRQKHEKNGQINLLGVIPNNQLPPVYSACELMLFPSEIDTFGMAVLEAQACGVPVLVSHIGGPRNIIKDGVTGYMLSTDNIGLWRSRLEEIHSGLCRGENKLAEMGVNARSRTLRHFDFYRILDNFLYSSERAAEKQQPASEVSTLIK